MTQLNFFKDLELGLNASAGDVREAYKRLAKLWHPDKNKEEKAEDKFKQILAAYTHLQSDDRRETHAREIRRQAETPQAAATPKPPPQQPQTSPKTPTSSHQSKYQETSDFKNEKSNTRPQSGRSKNAKTDSGTKNTQRNWWDSFKAKNATAGTETSFRKPTSKHKQARPPPRFTFMNSFLFDDPFDEILFNVFMIPPERPPAKPKSKTDPFGNKLPTNLAGDIYDWKTATKLPGQRPDYQEYLDDDTEFSCHYCGLMMNMEMLRKHELKCQRLGGKKVPPNYQFDDEEINEAYTNNFRPQSSFRQKPGPTCKIKCRWCGLSCNKNDAAEHIAQCKSEMTTPRTHKRGQARPEWNNNFTETEYEDLPEHNIYSRRPKSAQIDVDDFSPFTGGSRSTCLQCKVKYGLSAPNFCTH